MSSVSIFMQNNVRERAYAKINLALSVTGKMGDYHSIETLFQSIDLYDEVTLSRRDDSLVTSDFQGDNSLVVLSALQRKFSLGGMHLSTKKNIPIGGGLGGSSADAAAAALACTHLFDLSTAEVYDSVKNLFGDIAFQMMKGTAFARGIGSEIERLAPLPPYYVLLVFPQKGVSTKDAYALSDRYPYNGADLYPLYERLLRGKNAQDLYVNDLLPPAVLLNDEITPLLREMKDPAALLTGMSGSGSTLFSLYKTEEAARAQAKVISAPTLITKTFSPRENENK